MNYASKGNFDLLDKNDQKKADTEVEDRLKSIYCFFLPLVR